MRYLRDVENEESGQAEIGRGARSGGKLGGVEQPLRVQADQVLAVLLARPPPEQKVRARAEKRTVPLLVDCVPCVGFRLAGDPAKSQAPVLAGCCVGRTYPRAALHAGA